MLSIILITTVLSRFFFVQCFLYRIPGKAPKDKASIQREILDSILKDGAFYTHIVYTGLSQCTLFAPPPFGLRLRWHVPADAAPLYEHSCQTLGWTVDEGRMSSMRKANEEQLSKLEASIKDAEENLGDIEVRDAFLAKADYLYKIGAHSSDPWASERHS